MARRARIAGGAGARARGARSGGARALLLAVALALPTAAAANSPPVFNPPSSPPVVLNAWLVMNGPVSRYSPGMLLAYASDPDGDALTVDTTPVAPPARGTLVLAADGSFTYEAEYKPGGLSDLSPVNFTIRILDGKGGSLTADFELHIRERPGRGLGAREGRGRQAGLPGGTRPRGRRAEGASAGGQAGAKQGRCAYAGRIGRTQRRAHSGGRGPGCRAPRRLATRPWAPPRGTLTRRPRAASQPPCPAEVGDTRPWAPNELRYTTPYGTTLKTTAANRLFAYARDADSPTLTFALAQGTMGSPPVPTGPIGAYYGTITSFDPATGDFTYVPSPKAGVIFPALDFFYYTVSDGASTARGTAIITVGAPPGRAAGARCRGALRAGDGAAGARGGRGGAWAGGRQRLRVNRAVPLPSPFTPHPSPPSPPLTTPQHPSTPTPAAANPPALAGRGWLLYEALKIEPRVVPVDAGVLADMADAGSKYVAATHSWRKTPLPGASLDIAADGSLKYAPPSPVSEPVDGYEVLVLSKDNAAAWRVGVTFQFGEGPARGRGTGGRGAAQGWGLGRAEGSRPDGLPPAQRGQRLTASSCPSPHPAFLQSTRSATLCRCPA
jgi:hypothetical protein